MKKGEHATFRVQPSYAYSSEGNPSLQIPGNTELIYEIKLLEFKKEKESWEMDTFTEKEEAAIRRKTEGNNFFAKDKMILAIRKYKKALDIFSYESGLTEQEKEIVKKDIKLPSLLNLAACYLKTKEYKEVIENTNKALELDPLSVKGLWRRGCALTETGDWEDAKLAFKKALQIEPDNKSVISSLTRLNKIISERDKEDKKRFKNMFQRLEEMEKKESK